jgi:hypothetical protein
MKKLVRNDLRQLIDSIDDSELVIVAGGMKAIKKKFDTFKNKFKKKQPGAEGTPGQQGAESPPAGDANKVPGTDKPKASTWSNSQWNRDNENHLTPALEEATLDGIFKPS